MQGPLGDPAAKAVALATGLRKNVTAVARRWSQWPGGAQQAATIAAILEGIRLRIDAARDEAALAQCMADLRAVLEWTTYQSASLRTARAAINARRTQTMIERLGLVQSASTGIPALAASESALIESVGTTNGYMLAIAERAPHLGFPRPLVPVESLARRTERRRSGRLGLIQLLSASARERSKRR
jgi:hypothetical protein